MERNKQYKLRMLMPFDINLINVLNEISEHLMLYLHTFILVM